MNPFDLPDECWLFLSAGAQLDFNPDECEAGPVRLRSAQELKLECLPVETYPNTYRDDAPPQKEDGFYYVLTVPLTEGERVSEAVLSWLPVEKSFATYNDDHHDLLLFPTATWEQIIGEPLRFLNAMWEIDERNDDFVREIKPWLQHPFRVGLTLDAVERNRAV